MLHRTFFIFGVLVFLFGFAILSGSKSAVHEIEAFILFLIGVVMVATFIVTSAVNNASSRLESALKRLEGKGAISTPAPTSSAPVAAEPKPTG